MSPKELRALRESLALSRVEFARRPFISQPTLGRWERGEGGPREVHLHILRRMRDHLGAGHSIGYFQYDAAGVREADPLRVLKQLLIETLRGIAAVVLAEKQTDDGRDWSLRFGLGWTKGEPVDLALICDGSERPERPVIDFTLDMAGDCGDLPRFQEALQAVASGHGVFWKFATDGKGRFTAGLGHRVFTTGCNPETIKHVLGNYYSCWQRLKRALGLAGPGQESPSHADSTATDSSVPSHGSLGERQARA